MTVGVRGSVWPTLIMAMGLMACGKSTETVEPVEAVVVPEEESLPQTGEPAVPQPDRASAPLVPKDDVNAEPIIILGEETPIRFVGQEPDWEAIIDEGWVVFERPGLPLIEAPMPEIEDTSGGVLTLDAGKVQMIFTPAGCESPVGTLAVEIKYDDVSYQGCGGHQEESPPEPVDVSWQGLIYDYLPAIDACLDAADGPRLVRALYPREGNTAGMILMDDVGRYDECGADATSGEISFFDPVTSEQAAVWLEGNAAFERAESGASCRAVQPMLDLIIGDDLGIMHPSGCR